ncbi:MAG: copper resistance protein NlpE [Treponema sp.]|jgi:uncharacterized lipoprotein NlpE involved in copper resistance|nr:copper resistance protein NlpE [Treponema sp.]
MTKNIAFSFVLIAIILVAGMVSCATTQAVDAVHNSKNSLDWEGTYSGRIPAADGPGIDVEITLNPDQNITIVYKYVDRDFSAAGIGKFHWDDTGNVVIYENNDFPRYYKVCEGYLLHLDMEGQIITGDLADHYVLRKHH